MKVAAEGIIWPRGCRGERRFRKGKDLASFLKKGESGLKGRNKGKTQAGGKGQIRQLAETKNGGRGV